jgi:hypothetical protein
MIWSFKESTYEHADVPAEAKQYVDWEGPQESWEKNGKFGEGLVAVSAVVITAIVNYIGSHQQACGKKPLNHVVWAATKWAQVTDPAWYYLKWHAKKYHD